MAVTLIKEDGTGAVSGANAYEDVAGANQYMENTNRKDEWTAFSQATRRAALLTATQYMDDRYRCRYLGVRQESTEDTQPLEFPREDLFFPSGAEIPAAQIPVEILEACAEFALIAAAGPIQPDPVYDSTGRSVERKLVRVEGAVTKDTTYGGSPTPVLNRRYPAAEQILSRWLRPRSRTLLRA